MARANINLPIGTKEIYVCKVREKNHVYLTLENAQRYGDGSIHKVELSWIGLIDV